ncbi:MAG: NfeD family protein [Oscillospiraceae bacterium]|nr:NfeD family protein [Oscillospiraceae bacterium]
MEWFSNWWNLLEMTEQILFCIAIPSTVLLVIQAILIMVGGAGGADAGGDFGDVGGVGDVGDAGDIGDVHSGDFDGSGHHDFGVMSMLSIQGIASFFCVFGWSSLFMYRSGVPLIIAVITAIVLGLLVMYALAKIMLYLNKLSHSGTLDVKNLLGNMGTVYLRIPPKGEGKGKVMVQTSERFVEFDAVSEKEEYIANNTEVRVIDIIGENVLVVETI